MQEPKDFIARVNAVGQQIKSLYELNQRFSTNFNNLSRAISYGVKNGLLQKLESDDLWRSNTLANDAKHHDLGNPAGIDDRYVAFDSADFGIVQVLKASQVEYLEGVRVREIFLLGLARDPDKDQMGAGEKTGMNRRLYALQKKGFVKKAENHPDHKDAWKFQKDMPTSLLLQGDAKSSGSVLPSASGSVANDTKNVATESVTTKMGAVSLKTDFTDIKDQSEENGSCFKKEAVLNAVTLMSEPLSVDEVALVCLGITDLKKARKELSVLLKALRDEGQISETSGRWMKPSIGHR